MVARRIPTYRAPGTLLHLAALVLVLLCADATVHSIDQIRDLNVARALADGTAVPAASPRFSDRYTLPPYFYFVLAIPLWFSRHAPIGFIAFGLFHVLAVAWSGRWLARERLGSELVFAAVGYGFPILFLAHSAWNNGHLFAWNCLLLVATLRAWRSGGWWIALQAALLVLVCTISPSAVPFGLTTLLILVRHRRDARAWASIALAAIVHVPMFWFWLRHDPNAQALVAGGGAAQPFAERVSAFATNLVQFGKWRDAWFLPASQAREMVGAWAGWLVGGALAVIAALAVFGALSALRSREDASGGGGCCWPGPSACGGCWRWGRFRSAPSITSTRSCPGSRRSRLSGPARCGGRQAHAGARA